MTMSKTIGWLPAAAGAESSFSSHQELDWSASEGVTLGLFHSRTLVQAALETNGLRLPLHSEEVMQRVEAPRRYLQMGSGSTGMKGASLGAGTFLESEHNLSGLAVPLVAVTGTIDLKRNVGPVDDIGPKLDALEPFRRRPNLIRYVLYPAANEQEVVDYFAEKALPVDERFHAVGTLDDVIKIAATNPWAIDKDCPSMVAHSSRLVERLLKNWHDLSLTGEAWWISGKYQDKAAVGPGEADTVFLHARQVHE